jgi:hypothetical protein
MSEYMQESQNILFNYFNNIVFIDDDFILNRTSSDIDTVDTLSDFEKFDPTSDITELDGEVATQDEKMMIKYTIHDNIAYLLEECKRKKLHLFPYLFNEEDTVEEILKFVSNANLIILDWQLFNSSYQKTLEILEALSNQDTLRLVLIYTNNDDMDMINSEIVRSFYGKCITVNKENSLLKVNSVYIMTASKKSYKIEQALQLMNDVLIENYGYLFISFFDLSQQIQTRTGKILFDFMHPFEALLTLQLTNDSFNENDYEEYLRNIILNHLNDAITINSFIIKGMLNNYKNKLSSIKRMKLSEIANRIKNSVKDSSFFYSNSVVLASLNDKFNRKILKKQHFNSLLSIILTDNLYLSNEKKSDKFRVTLDKIKTDAGLDNEEKKFISNNFELLILSTLFESNETIETLMGSLLKLMKLIPYKADKWEDIIDNLSKCIKKKQKFMDNSRNIISYGDVLVNDDNTKFLLCITPPCDALRPGEKVEYRIKYLLGEKTDIGLLGNSRESLHFTLLPFENKVINVKWSFYKEKTIDLSYKNDLKYLKEFKRPYKMQKEYIQQIVSEYISFWSRSGVNEVFLKNKNHKLSLNFRQLLKD